MDHCQPIIEFGDATDCTNWMRATKTCVGEDFVLSPDCDSTCKTILTNNPNFFKEKCPYTCNYCLSKTSTTPTKVVSTVVTIEGVDFDKVEQDSAIKNKLVNTIKQGYLANLDGYTMDDLTVVLSKGSLKATVSITPKEGESSADLKKVVQTVKLKTESAVMYNVQGVIKDSGTDVMEEGKTLADMTISSTAPQEVTAPNSTSMSSRSSQLVLGYMVLLSLAAAMKVRDF
jgi:hypothetical protein